MLTVKELIKGFQGTLKRTDVSSGQIAQFVLIGESLDGSVYRVNIALDSSVDVGLSTGSVLLFPVPLLATGAATELRGPLLAMKGLRQLTHGNGMVMAALSAASVTGSECNDTCTECPQALGPVDIQALHALLYALIIPMGSAATVVRQAYVVAPAA